MNEVTEFLNVDLELRSRSGLDELIDAFRATAFVLHHKANDFVSLELNQQPESIDRAILLFFDSVQLFAPHQRHTWDKCDKRTFDVGIQAGAKPRQTPLRFSQDTLARLAALKAEVNITIYGTDHGKN
jgi:hypothetical protein